MLLILFLRAVFLLKGASADHADIFSFVSVGYVLENARLVDVDGCWWQALKLCAGWVALFVSQGLQFEAY